MQFLSLPVARAKGAILVHAQRAGSRLFKKGRVLSAEDLDLLRASGISQITVARLDADDVGEDEAALRLAELCAGENVRVGAAFTGRANLYAEAAGLVTIDAALVDAVNAVHEAITLATLPSFTRVTARQMLATIKIIPFAVPRGALDTALAVLQRPPVRLARFCQQRVALITTCLETTKPSILDKTRGAVEDRLRALGSTLVLERRVDHAPAPIVPAIHEAMAAGCDLILLFGASAITDRRDVIPAAIQDAGGHILHFGMPVDPGNLLLLAKLGSTTLIGLPGCARSPKLNGFDFVLWRHLAGLSLTARDLMGMGVGGLLSEIPLRPQPRDETEHLEAQAPYVSAVVLAAGQSTRMGRNKLLEPVNGKPLIRYAVEAALASQADETIVVTGHDADALKAALSGLEVRIVHNPEYAKGLSTSVRCGLAAIGDKADGALMLLGDMPAVDAELINRLIAAFAPQEGRAICLASRKGARGNPVLWARRFFDAMAELEGDIGARNLLAAYPELIAEVEAMSDAPLRDIDTPEALAALRSQP
ncbi:MAG: molybdopterin-binding/glycosyltransferase family 2 protein [Alphaproteobacteria bacterium]|nr:molybdopterin-binding/glycosyltransferase family 2 protein [Alphaproteobacteria bacterium]